MSDTDNRRAQRPTGRLTLAGACIAAAVASAGCAASAAGHPAAAGNHHAPTSTTTASPGSPPNSRTITRDAVRRLLAELSAPADAQQRTSAPAKPLRNQRGLPDRHRVSRTHWWVAPGNVAATLAYFKAHPVSDTSLAGTGSVGGPHSGNVQSLDFAADGPWLRPKTYTQLELEVDVMKIGDHVGIRAEADAIVLPRRTRAEHIPTTVRSVHVVVGPGRSGRKIVRTLGTAAARRLARIVNQLPVANPEPIPCPADLPGYQDTLTFRGAGSPIRVSAQSDGCGAVTVYRPRALHPVLSDGAAVDHAVRAALRDS